MRKELGKWLMDIAKYITTAVVLTSIFRGVQEEWIIYVGGSLAVVITLFGRALARQGQKERRIKHGCIGNVRACFYNSHSRRDLFQPPRQERLGIKFVIVKPVA